LAGGGVGIFGNGTITRPLNLRGSGPSAGVAALDNEGEANTWSGAVVLETDSTIGARGGKLTVSGNISGGSRSLTKRGPGEVALAGSNGYLNTSVQEGTLTAQSNEAVPGNVLSVSPGATFQLRNFIQTSAALNLELRGHGVAGRGALYNGHGINTVAGPVYLMDETSIGAAAGTILGLMGSIIENPAGPGPARALVINGPGTVFLGNDKASSAYSGGTVINGGTLAIISGGSLGGSENPVTINSGGKLLVGENTATDHPYTLNTGSIQVNADKTFTYTGGSVSGGFLRGPGTHELTGSTNFNAVTALPGTNIVQDGPVFLNNFTNSGTFTNNADLAWDGGYNTASGHVIVNGTLTTAGFENNGTITINGDNPAATAAGMLANSENDLASGGGSRLTIQSGGLLQLNGTSLNLHGALAVNNGTIAGGTTNVYFGALAAGTGSFGTVVIHPGGAYTPGVSLANMPALTPRSTGVITPLDPNQSNASPVQLAADTVAAVSASDQALHLPGPMSGPGKTLTKEGDGTLALGHLRASGLVVNGGRVRIIPNGAPSGTSKLDAVSFAAASANAQLDLSDNKLIVVAGDVGRFDGTRYSGLTGQVASAYNFSSWDGPGIATSMFDAGPERGVTTLAVATADEVFYAGGTFGGVSVSSGDVLVMYTYAGDLNMDGLIDGADYGVIDNNVQFPGTSGYANGDINYDGVIDGADYGVIDNAIQFQGAPFPSGTYPGASQSAAGVTAVPEPAGGLAAVVAGLLLGRRRRRR
jgi:autotransporter-associated beta strand protein